MLPTNAIKPLLHEIVPCHPMDISNNPSHPALPAIGNASLSSPNTIKISSSPGKRFRATLDNLYKNPQKWRQMPHI